MISTLIRFIVLKLVSEILGFGVGMTETMQVAAVSYQELPGVCFKRQSSYNFACNAIPFPLCK